MSNPTAAQVPMLLTRARNRIAVINSKGAMRVAERRDGEIFVQQDAELIADLHNHLRTLAQAHADQQARLTALVGKWQSRTEQCIEQAEKAKSRTERESWISTEIATRNCADELEAALGEEK